MAIKIQSLEGFSHNPIISINPRAKRIIFRFDVRQNRPVIVLPHHKWVKKIYLYKDAFNQWVNRFSPSPKTLFEDGLVFPFKGKSHVLRTVPLSISPPKVCLEDDTLLVHSHPDDTTMHIKRFFQQEALDTAKLLSSIYAKTLGVTLVKITVKDMKSMWGRCLRQEELCYNWRLILAPPAVFDYVAAHEVSHCLHPNHSLSFWATVASICPHHKESRLWLKKNSNTLMRYSF